MPPTTIDLDSPLHRDVARRSAEESVVLPTNDGALPLVSPDRPMPTRVAVLGPNADDYAQVSGAQPYSDLHPILGGRSEVSSTDSTPVLPFGHGLAYTRFTRTHLSADDEGAAGDTFTAQVRVHNTGEPRCAGGRGMKQLRNSSIESSTGSTLSPGERRARHSCDSHPGILVIHTPE